MYDRRSPAYVVQNKSWFRMHRRMLVACSRWIQEHGGVVQFAKPRSLRWVRRWSVAPSPCLLPCPPLSCLGASARSPARFAEYPAFGRGIYPTVAYILGSSSPFPVFKGAMGSVFDPDVSFGAFWEYRKPHIDGTNSFLGGIYNAKNRKPHIDETPF